MASDANPAFKAAIAKESPTKMHGGPLHKHEKGHNDGLKKGSELTEAEKKKMKEESVFGPEGKKVAKPPKNKKEKK